MRSIEGYEGLYTISRTGRVWSCRRKIWIKTTIKNNGYEQVQLSKDGQARYYLVHRLVAKAYIDNPDNLPCVNHKDEDKLNNRASNLEWCDAQYNNTYGGRIEKLNKKVRCLETGIVYPSVKAAGEMTHTQATSITQVCRGKLHHAGGYRWEYVREETNANNIKRVQRNTRKKVS